MRGYGLAIAASALLFASSALAAPFCVVSSSGQQCFYYDYPSCQQAAETARGACVANGNEQQQRSQSSTGAPFCVVASFGRQCFYYDAPSCQQAAASARGACVVNPNR